MTDSPMDMIEKYLERVRVYLPVGSEDTLTEIRTHLIQEAENLGRGKITHGSAMLAIERFGDPKDAASEYAGLGKKVGPIPAEYAGSALRIILVLVALSSAFLVGAYVIGIALGTYWPVDLGFISNFPFSIPIMVIMSLIYAMVIIGGLSLLDRNKAPTEKTAIEGFLGIGSGAFKPKMRWEGAADAVFGVLAVFFILLPQIQILFVPEFLPLLAVGAVLFLISAIHGLMYFFGGENNVNLLSGAVVGAGWVIFSLFLINIQFPLQYVWNNTNGVWSLFPLAVISEMTDGFFPFTTIWIVVIFIIVVTNMWEMVVSTMKIPMYMGRGKRWWWKGEWGYRRPLFKPKARKSDAPSTATSDGFGASNNQ